MYSLAFLGTPFPSAASDLELSYEYTSRRLHVFRNELPRKLTRPLPTRVLVGIVCGPTVSQYEQAEHSLSYIVISPGGEVEDFLLGPLGRGDHGLPFDWARQFVVLGRTSDEAFAKLYGRYFQPITLCDGIAGNLVPLVSRGSSSSSVLLVSPSGKRALGSTGDSHLVFQVSSPACWKTTGAIPADGGANRRAMFALDGSLLVSQTDADGRTRFEHFAVDEGAPKLLSRIHVDGRVSLLAASSDGTQGLFVSGRQVWCSRTDMPDTGSTWTTQDVGVAIDDLMWGRTDKFYTESHSAVTTWRMESHGPEQLRTVRIERPDDMVELMTVARDGQWMTGMGVTRDGMSQWWLFRNGDPVNMEMDQKFARQAHTYANAYLLPVSSEDQRTLLVQGAASCVPLNEIQIDLLDDDERPSN